MAKSLNVFMAVGLTALSLTLMGAAAYAQEDATVGFLMPDQGSTRYEEHDSPGFINEMKKLCPGCKVIYQNADGDISRQQQQFNSLITQSAKVIVLDPVDSAAALAGQAGASGGVKIIATTVHPGRQADYYVSFDNEGIGKAIADSLVGLKARRQGRDAPASCRSMVRRSRGAGLIKKVSMRPRLQRVPIWPNSTRRTGRRRGKIEPAVGSRVSWQDPRRGGGVAAPAEAPSRHSRPPALILSRR